MTESIRKEKKKKEAQQFEVNRADIYDIFLKMSVSGCPAGKGKSKLDSNISVTYFRI